MKELHLIVDCQYGSCGKGLFAGYLALEKRPDTIITAWAPNAGHTFIDGAGNKMVNIALPNGIISASVKRVLLGPGSVIDPQQLRDELARYAHHMQGVELLIHPHAAIVTGMHRHMEQKYAYRIGSTMKGAGEAQIQKMKRDPDSMNTAAFILKDDPALGPCVVTMDEYNRAMDEAQVAMIEGAQGFSLSLNQGFYPYVTSRDCTTHQLLSDCGVPHQILPTVHGVCRTYPIRVNNREHSSGPCYPDQREITWGELGVEPELTTVTKLPRRVFTFSLRQIECAVRMNGVHDIFLNFLNYINDDDAIETLVRDIQSRTGATVRWGGWGPKVTDIRGMA